MKPASILLAVLFLFATSYVPHSYAADDAIATMAKIVISLQHFPSDADKESLAAISAGSSSDSVKAVAGAIAGISHSASAADKAMLGAIAADEGEPAALRELAAIVAGINHVPSDSAKAALETLAAN